MRTYTAVCERNNPSLIAVPGSVGSVAHIDTPSFASHGVQIQDPLACRSASQGRLPPLCRRRSDISARGSADDVNMLPMRRTDWALDLMAFQQRCDFCERGIPSRTVMACRVFWSSRRACVWLHVLGDPNSPLPRHRDFRIVRASSSTAEGRRLPPSLRQPRRQSNPEQPTNWSRNTRWQCSQRPSRFRSRRMTLSATGQVD